MKPVTQDRIRKTIASIGKHRDRVLAPTEAIISQACLTGMRSVMGADTTTDIQRLDLEFDFAGQPKTMESAEHMMSEMWRQVERFSAREKRVYQFQERHGISGLVPGSTTIGDRTIPIMEEDESLALIPSDLEVLRSQKASIVDLFFGCLHSPDGLSLYVDRDKPDYWVHCEDDVLSVAAKYYDWAIAWEVIGYISPSQIKAQGFDQQRPSPHFSDDEKRWEIFLYLGCGLATHAPKESITFCAANVVPSI